MLLFLVTGRKPRSGKLPVLNLLRPKIRFSPRSGDSLQRFTSQGRQVCFDVQNFTSIAAGGNAAPKYQKFPLVGKELPRRGDSLDRFRKFFCALYAYLLYHGILNFM